MPELKTLTQKFADLYPSEIKVKRLLAFAKIPTAGMSIEGDAIDMWFGILSVVIQNKEQLTQLLKEAHLENPQDDYLKASIEEESPLQLKTRTDATDQLNAAYNFSVEDLKTLVTNGKLKQTLSKLDLIAGSLSNEFRNSIGHTRARLNNLERENAQGLLGRQDYNIEKNHIRNAIVYLIDEIDNEQEVMAIIAKIGPAASVKDTPTKLSVDSAALEKVMGGRSDIVEIDWLTKAIEASKSVCKIELSMGGAGTGWIIGGKYLMTNNHVLPSAGVATKARAIFNFQKDNVDGETIFALDPEGLFQTSKELDYAIVGVKDATGLAQFGSLEVETFKDPAKDELVNIIQHPMGTSKKLAMPDEVISIWPEKNFLFYLADTEPGSSGSPVFNQDWKVIALHHAGRDAEGGGLVINAAGEQKESNRGILIKAILKDLASKGVDL